MSESSSAKKQTATPQNWPYLRPFAFVICAAILLLIFFGGQVKSNDAGLAVPDWPMTYGENPITYHPSKWVGGIFYEHFHRLLAGSVALLSLFFALLTMFVPAQRWIKFMAWGSVAAVLLQALLGGLTVWYMLPVWASGSHAVLAQTYLVLNVIIAYGLSKDYQNRKEALLTSGAEPKKTVYAAALVLIFLVYIQLIFGGLTRHTESALAIPDFPTMGGQIIPRFDDAMLENINDWRFMHTDARGISFEDAEMYQVVLHFLHRLGAVIVTLAVLLVSFLSYKQEATNPKLFLISLGMCVLTLAQFMLGVMVVLTARIPIITSFHVAIGAVLLGLAVLLALQARPLRPREDTLPSGAYHATATAKS